MLNSEYVPNNWSLRYYKNVKKIISFYSSPVWISSVHCGALVIITVNNLDTAASSFVMDEAPLSSFLTSTPASSGTPLITDGESIHVVYLILYMGVCN